jgi:hypothetical protein
MFYKNKLKNYSKGGDERTIEVTGRSASITLMVGVVIFLIEMLVKVIITKDLNSIIGEFTLFIVMIILFLLIHLLNKIPIRK